MLCYALGALGVRIAATFSGRPPPLPDSHSREGTGSAGGRRIARKRVVPRQPLHNLRRVLGALGVRVVTTFSGRPPPLPDSHSREGTGSTGRRRIARKRTAALPSRAIARPAAKRRTTAIGPAAGCRMAVVQLRAATSGSVPSGAAATDSPAAGCCRGSLAAGYYQRVRPLVPPQATVQLRAAVGRRFSCGLPSVVQLRAATSGTGASRHTSTGQLRADRRRALAMVRQVLGRPVYRRQWRQSPP